MVYATCCPTRQHYSKGMCRSCYTKQWWANNPDKKREQHLTQKPRERKRRRDTRLLINEAKNRPCADCGQRFPPCCMDFDHVRGTKVASVTRLVTSSIQKILAEIAKCDLVCANCHRIRTHRRREHKYTDVEELAE